MEQFLGQCKSKQTRELGHDFQAALMADPKVVIMKLE